MALPLILGLLGSTLGAGATTGILGTLGAVGAGAVGSGLGRFAETGDFEEGLKTGLTSFVGGKALGTLGKAFGGTGVPAGETTRKIADYGMGGVNPQSFGQNFMSTLKDPISFGQAAIAQGAIPPPPMPELEKVEFDNRERMAPDRIMRRPPPGYRPGFDPEFDYRVAPNYGTRVMREGGSLQNPDKADLDDDGQLSSYERTRGMAIEKSMADQGKSMGGIIELIGQNPEIIDYLANTTALTGLGGLAAVLRRKYKQADKKEFREGGLPKMTDDMPEMPDDMDGETLMINAIMALQGMSSDPEQDLMEFVSAFGMDALQDLQRRVSMGEMGGGERGVGRLIEGAGDGMSDSVDAEIVNDMSDPSGSGQPLKVADGEYVIAADAVADIGNGSTDAGAKKLDTLMKQVRMARHGTTKQPPEKDMMSVMKRSIT